MADRSSRVPVHQMRLGRDIFTLGQAGGLIGVSPRQMREYCEGGMIAFVRLPPVSRSGSAGPSRAEPDRRVYRSDLIAFAREWGLRIALPERVGAVALRNPPEGAEAMHAATAGALAATGQLGKLLIGCGDGLASAVEVARVVAGLAPGIVLELVLSADVASSPLPAGLFAKVVCEGEATAAVPGPPPRRKYKLVPVRA